MHQAFKLLRRALLIAFILAQVAVGASAMPAPQSEPQSRLFLPTLRGGVLPSNNFGVEVSRLSTERGLQLIATSGTRWVRRGALNWKYIEPSEGGGYNWDHPAVKALEEDMVAASQLGVNLIVTVTGSPLWAVEPHVADCAPIHPDYYDEFARFMTAAVQRYSAHPYNMRFWELGNEPDAPIFGADSVFGCWGVESDPYFGGRAYGEMLKVAYPAIKAANPNVQVLNGGLLLDRPYNPADPRSMMGRFFEGVLAAGAGSSFDLLSFHAYTYWRDPGQPALGPREDWRIAYLKELLGRYGVAEKPMLRTEGALLCPGEVTPECRWAQADFLSRIFVRSMRDGLLANIWYVYDSDSYHNTALIEPGDVFVPRPAYFAYRHAARMLKNAAYVGPIEGLVSGVEGYRFRVDQGAEILYILWTDAGGVPVTLEAPLGANVVCSKRDGGRLPCSNDGGRIAVEAVSGPIFVQIR
jgi:hypothetical protein